LNRNKQDPLISIFVFFIILALALSAVCAGCNLILQKINNGNRLADTSTGTLAGDKTSGETTPDAEASEGLGGEGKDSQDTDNAGSTAEDTPGDTAEDTSGDSAEDSSESSSKDTAEDTQGDIPGDTAGSQGDDEGARKYAVIVSGASYDMKHYGWFLNSTAMAHSLLKSSGFSDEDIYYLFESGEEKDVDARATFENFSAVMEKLQDKSCPADTIFFFFIGHGTSQGTNSYYSLCGYNLKDEELAGMCGLVKRDRMVFVFSPCNSGGFIDDLSGQNTIVITSTRADESNRAAFIEPFLESFNGPGDADSNGVVSFAEAFNYAGADVISQYANNNWGPLTEHAQLDDNGDKNSHEAPVPAGGDGKLSQNTFLK